MKNFTVKKEHLLLLKKTWVSWDDCEFGAPEIDPKRPYGNSDVYQDMLEILGLKELKEGIYEFTLNNKKWLLKGEDKYNIYLEGKDEESLLKELNKLHKELETTLQIVLSAQKFKPGRYIADDYDNNWRLDKSSSSHKGLSFVITGTLTDYTRKEIEQLIKENGGKVTSSVSKNTDFLVVGKDPGSNKLNDAFNYNISTINAKELLKMLK